MAYDCYHQSKYLNPYAGNNAISDEGLNRLTRRCWPMLRDLNLSQNGITKLDLDPSAIKNIQKLGLAKNVIKEVVSLA